MNKVCLKEDVEPFHVQMNHKYCVVYV